MKSPSPSPTPYPWPPIVYGILGAALILRLVVLFQIHKTVWFMDPLLDAGYYDQWAQRIAAGDWIGHGVFYMSPGYSYFLALLYAILGRSLVMVATIQILLGVATGYAVFEIGRRMANLRVGILAMALWLFYGAAMFYELMLVKSTVINAANVAALLGLLIGRERLSWKWLLLSGVCLGLSAQFRPSILLFVPLAATWLWMAMAEPSPRRRGAMVAAFLAGAMLVVGAVGLRNLIVGGQWIITTAHGGNNFYLGNHAGFDGTYRPLPFVRPDPRFEKDDFHREAERRVGRPLTDKEESRYWYDLTWKEIESAPGAWIGKLGKKFLVFWNRYEYPINIDSEFYRKKAGLMGVIPLLGYGLLAALAVFGLAQSRLGTRQGWREGEGLLALYALSYLASGMIYFVVAEYRMPVVLAWCVFGAIGIMAWRDALSKRSVRYLVVTMGIFVLALVATHIKIPRSLDCNSQHQLAVTLMESRQFAPAIQELERGLQECPEFIEIRLSLANAYIAVGDFEKGGEQLEAARRLKPEDSRVIAKSGAVAFRQKNYPLALHYYEAALAKPHLDPPDREEAHNGAGIALSKMERHAEAIAHYEAILAVNPKSSITYNNRAYAYLHLQKPDLAEKDYRRAIELKPDYLEARLRLAELLANRGRREEALHEVETLRKMAGDHPRLQALEQKLSK